MIQRQPLLLTLALCVVSCAPAASSDVESAVGEAGAAAAGESVGRPLADPREYLRIHNLASDTAADGWLGAIETLASAGDAFTLQHFGRIDRASLSDADGDLLARASESISERLRRQGAGIGADVVVAHLERAAYADLMCDVLEGPLRSWTLETIKAELHDPAVVAELQRLQGDYVPSVALETMFSSMSERVPRYAQQLLEAAPKHGDRP